MHSKLRRFLLAALTVCAIGVVATTASADNRGKGKHPGTEQGTPWGTLVVRFEPGTSFDAMESTINNLGGAVVSDLRQVDAVSAIGVKTGFATKVSDASGVADVFPDKQVSIRRADTSHRGRGDRPDKPGNQADPWHAQYQWDADRMNVVQAWSKGKGEGQTVAVIDSGIEQTHKDLKANYVNGESFIPCKKLNAIFGPELVKQLQLRDCGLDDESGHGTFLSGRIAGALNGFASNGIAPRARVLDRKVLAGPFTIFDSSWAIEAMLNSCDDGADVLNLSLIVYDDPAIESDAQDYLLWKDAVDYCREKGVVLVAGAGNDHVRVNKVNIEVGGVQMSGAGQVDTGDDGIGLTGPGEDLFDLRGMLPAPAGVPGVIMVSGTNNRTEDAGAVPNRFSASVTGQTDQLAYYSNYGSRVDLAAPGGARAFNLPSYDAGEGNVYTGPWGIFSSLSKNGSFCKDEPTGCFQEQGSAFGWMQGTSMATAEVSGVVALVLSARPNLRDNPDALLAKLKQTARTNMTNFTGPMDPDNTSDTLFGPCSAGFCHLDFSQAISFSDAYGAGIVNAAAAAGAPASVSSLSANTSKAKPAKNKKQKDKSKGGGKTGRGLAPPRH